MIDILSDVAFGAKKMREEIDEVKTKTNKTVSNIKTALQDLDI